MTQLPLKESSAVQVAQATPTISVVVPVYNTQKYLCRCLDSLLGQTFADFEVILVNDGSTDESSPLLESYTAKFAACTLIHQENQGLSVARNTGIAAAQGSFIAFVDSDDWVAPTYLETLYRAISETESDISQVSYVSCSKPEKVTQPKKELRLLSSTEALTEMFLTEQYAVWIRLYARHLFEEDETFPSGLTCEDRVANFTLLSKAKRIAVSNQVEYFYFLNLGSISFDGLNRRGFDLLVADSLVVDRAKKLGSAQILHLAEDRAAKGAYSLLVKHARFGITDATLDEKTTLTQLTKRFEQDYARLMASPLSFPKKLVAWQLRYTPWLLQAEFWFFNVLTNTKPRKKASL